MRRGDSFVYLDKRRGGYTFTGHGTIECIRTSGPPPPESRPAKVNSVFTAEIVDFFEYSNPLDIRSTSALGRENRSALGIVDVNRLGWSRSIARLNSNMFEQIVDLAYRGRCIAVQTPELGNYEVPEAWSFVRRRHSLEGFRQAVLDRQNHACAICATTLREVLDVAHISAYAIDVKNRANPANGIGLCAYCHRAFDRGVFRLHEDGEVLLPRDTEVDQVAEAHLSSLSKEARSLLLKGIDRALLHKRFVQTGPSLPRPE